MTRRRPGWGNPEPRAAEDVIVDWLMLAFAGGFITGAIAVVIALGRIHL